MRVQHRYENSRILRNDHNAIKRAKREWFKEAEKVTIDWYKKSFNDGGFTNESFERWDRRKYRYKWPILLKTKALRNSIRIISSGINWFLVGSDIKYGVYHNEGTRKLPKRQFLGYSKRLTEKLIALLDMKIDRIYGR